MRNAAFSAMRFIKARECAATAPSAKAEKQTNQPETTVNRIILARSALTKPSRTKPPGKTDRERECRALDRLLWPFIVGRANHHCERCGRRDGQAMPRAGRVGRDKFIVLQPAHFKSRRVEHTRWDPDNIACLCKGCHFLWAHSEPDEFHDWWLQRIGEKRMARLNLIWQTRNRRAKLNLRLVRLAIEEVLGSPYTLTKVSDG